ncbi:hypothetical protein K439DRAFT_1624214 [Ramaria rubella]|nr:hypothetical protein K439DRAFT_1624214 [Ramaria rubella]
MMENQGNGINVLNNGGANVTLQTFTPGHFLHAGNVDKVPGFSSYVHSTMPNTVSTTQHAPAQLPTALQVQPQPGIMQYAPVLAADYVPTKHAECMYEHTDRFLDILENYSRSIGAVDTDTNLYNTTTAMGCHPHITTPTLDTRSTIIMTIATSIEADQGLPVRLGMVMEGTDPCPQDTYAGPGHQVISPRDCPGHTPLVNTTDVTTCLDTATEMASSM